MAIRFITGVPGAGKSMTAVQTLLKELRTGKREIVTNLALYPGVIWSYLKARFGVEVDIARITILGEDEIKAFYLHRGRGWKAPNPREKKEGGDGRIDYSACARGDELRDAKSLPNVLYMIEEAHVHFGSRQWADTAQSALFYLSQHRHLGDEVFFITQHVEQVDKALRRLTQEFWRMTNYGSKFPFGVKLPDVFVLDVFTMPPSLLARSIDTTTIRLDVDGLCGCYDTAAGVGMAGGLADTVNKRKGVPWQMAIAAVFVCMAILGALPFVFGKQAAKAVIPDVLQGKPTVTGTNKLANVGSTNAPALPSAAPLTPPALRPAPTPAMHTPIARMSNGAAVMATNATGALVVGPAIELEKPVRVKFFVQKESGSVVLGLDNGEIFTVGDGRLQIVGQLAILDGSRAYRLPR